jgi:hypothetical protein
LKSLFVLPLLVVLIVGSSTLAFAQTEYDIKIPSGASDPGAPYFWSESSTGVTTGEITVYPRDSITWHNGDTAFHTVTSVTQSGEEDGTFDSGFFTAGESYTRQFDDLGDFYYYCSLHPWMNGIVHVTDNLGSVQTIDKVASGFTDDGLGFEIKYILDTNLQSLVDVDSDEKTLTFHISGDTELEELIIVLPVELIDTPTVIWVDGKETKFSSEDVFTGTKLIIEMEPFSKEIKIMGAHVIPEFGFFAISILSVGLISTLFLARSKLSIF